jgi:hypothetical protein
MLLGDLPTPRELKIENPAMTKLTGESRINGSGGDDMQLPGKTTLISLVLSGCLLGGALPLMADRHNDCERRIHKAEYNLDRDVRRHGEQSRQAERRRHELNAAREQCREFDHDRDQRHDHDHDHDQNHN